jgi:hypothetical protein
MSDILGQGGDGPTRPWPRRLAAAAVLVLVAVVIILNLPRHRPGPAHPRAAARTAGSSGSAASISAAVPGALAYGPDGITGPTVPWDRSVRLPVSGQQPAWLSPATGRVSPIAGLPRDGAGYQFLRIAGGWAVQAGSGAQGAQRGRAGCGTCAGRPLPVYFLAAAARSATLVGTADQVAPGTTAGTMWLTSYPPGADMTKVPGTAREVSASGAALGPTVKLPVGYVIAQATDRGLLLTPAARQAGPISYRLWKPAAPRDMRTFEQVIAASASQIAWAGRCAPACGVQVLNLDSGRRTTIGLPAASSAASGAFSPDGALLALEVSQSNGGDDSALALRLDVVSLARGRITMVPDTFMSSDALAGFGWPAASDTLIAELSFTTKVQIASWVPGAARLSVAAIARAQTADSLIVG